MHKPAISREIPTFKGLCLILLQVPKLFGGSKHFVPNQKLIDILATAQFPIVFVPVQKWYSYGKFNFSTAAIKQLNAVLFLIWPKIFGLARNILGPVEGQGTRLKYIESWRKLSIQMLSITDKRTNVWSRDFMICKINSGLWSGLDCEIKGPGQIMSNFWGPFFHFFTIASALKSCIIAILQKLKKKNLTPKKLKKPGVF